MASLTEQQIAALAPNENALSNGRGISRSGDFSQLGRSADGTFYQGECRGSGSKPYISVKMAGQPPTQALSEILTAMQENAAPKP